MFRKIFIAIVLIISLGQAQYLNHYMADAGRASSEQVGYSDTYFADGSAGAVTIPTTWANDRSGGTCRGISADSSGIIKIDYTDMGGVTVTEVLYLIGGVIRPVRNVTKVHQYYTGTTAGTAKSFNSSGEIKANSIKLHR